MTVRRNSGHLEYTKNYSCVCIIIVLNNNLVLNNFSVTFGGRRTHPAGLYACPGKSNKKCSPDRQLDLENLLPMFRLDTPSLLLDWVRRLHFIGYLRG